MQMQCGQCHVHVQEGRFPAMRQIHENAIGHATSAVLTQRLRSASISACARYSLQRFIGWSISIRAAIVNMHQVASQGAMPGTATHGRLTQAGMRQRASDTKAQRSAAVLTAPPLVPAACTAARSSAHQLPARGCAVERGREVAGDGQARACDRR